MVDYSKTHSQRLRSVTLAGEMANMMYQRRVTSTAIGGGGAAGGKGGASGGGTPNALAKWVGSTNPTNALGDSRFLDDGIAMDLSYGNNVYTNLFVTGYGYDSSTSLQYPSKLILRSTRGTQGSCLPLSAGDFLGVLSWRGCEVAGAVPAPVQDAAKIVAQATPLGTTWTTTDHGCGLLFYTTPWGRFRNMKLAA